MYKQSNVEKLKQEFLHSQAPKWLGRLRDYRTLGAIKGALAGATTGASVAGLTAKDKDKKNWRSYITRAAKGAGAGALAGAGIGAAVAQLRLASPGLQQRLTNLKAAEDAYSAAVDEGLKGHTESFVSPAWGGRNNRSATVEDFLRTYMSDDEFFKFLGDNPHIRDRLYKQLKNPLLANSAQSVYEELKRQVRKEMRAQGASVTDKAVQENAKKYLKQMLGGASPGAISAKGALDKARKKLLEGDFKYDMFQKGMTTIGAGAAAKAVLNKKKTNAKSRRNSK